MAASERGVVGPTRVFAPPIGSSSSWTIGPGRGTSGPICYRDTLGGFDELRVADYAGRLKQLLAA